MTRGLSIFAIVVILAFVLLVFTWLNMVIQLVIFLATTATLGAMYG